MIKSGKYAYRWSFQKFITNMILLAILVSIGTFCFSLAVNATQEKTIEWVTVKPGDTLWSIAVSIAPDDDPRITVAKIKHLNELNGSDLIAGQNLKIEVVK